MADLTKVTSPGQVLVESIQLISANGFIMDLRAFVADLSIVESIQNIFITGTLTITESINLVRFAPIVGNEYIKVIYSTPGRKKIKYYFSITKVSPRVINGKTSTYYLELSSIGSMASTMNQISLSFNDMTYSDMILSLYNAYLFREGSTFTFANTLDKKNHIASYAYPADIISNITARSSVNGKFNFVFYETLRNEYKFVPLFDTQTEPAFEYSNFKAGIVGVNTLSEYTRIRELEVYETANLHKGMRSGAYGNGHIVVDNTFKTVAAENFTYNDMFEKCDHINKFPVLPKTQVIGTSTGPTTVCHVASYNHEFAKDNETYADIGIHRNFQLLTSNAFGLGIEVLGDSGRHVGDKVRIMIQSPQAADETSEKYDPYLSGLYVIVRLKHMIQEDQHIMHMHVIKDSHWYPVPEINE